MLNLSSINDVLLPARLLHVAICLASDNDIPIVATVACNAKTLVLTAWLATYQSAIAKPPGLGWPHKEY